jgi:hypothetical protein
LLEAGLSPTKGPDESALKLRRAGIAALVASIGAGMTSNVLFLAAFQFSARYVSGADGFPHFPIMTTVRPSRVL